MRARQIICAASILTLCIAATGCGCAKKTDIDALRSDLQREVKMVSDQSVQTSVTAAEAQRIAEEANNRSRNTEEALNRGFKKSMKK